MRFKLFNKLIIIRNPIKIYNIPSLKTIGITNRTKDGYFVFFADYDSVDYDVVLDDCIFLQKNFDIGTLIIRKTKEKINNIVNKVVGNYHVIGFTKFTFPEIKKLINLTRCDEHFKTAYKYQSRCWVLRIFEKTDIQTNKIVNEKPSLKQILISKTNREASKPHILLFEKLDNINLKKYFNKIDNEKKVEFIHYVTQDKRELK